MAHGQYGPGSRAGEASRGFLGGPFLEILLTETLHDLLSMAGHEALQRTAQRLRASRHWPLANMGEDLHHIHYRQLRSSLHR
jgi:hypothetical protein